MGLPVVLGRWPPRRPECGLPQGRGRTTITSDPGGGFQPVQHQGWPLPPHNLDEDVDEERADVEEQGAVRGAMVRAEPRPEGWNLSRGTGRLPKGGLLLEMIYDIFYYIRGADEQ